MKMAWIKEIIDGKKPIPYDTVLCSSGKNTLLWLGFWTGTRWFRCDAESNPVLDPTDPKYWMKIEEVPE